MSNKIVRTFMAALCAASIMFANPVTVTWANVTYTTPGNSNFKTTQKQKQENVNLKVPV